MSQINKNSKYYKPYATINGKRWLPVMKGDKYDALVCEVKGHTWTQTERMKAALMRGCSICLRVETFR